MTDPIRIAVVADIHHGQDNLTKKGTAALPLMDEFRRFVADARPDVVIDLGDRISDEDPETDRRLEGEVAEAFAPIAEPVLHLCGNHDRDHLSVADNAEILGQSLEHATVDLGGWRLVLWRADTLIRRPGGFRFDDADLAWLEATIAAADRPLAIVSHVPVSGHSQVGNFYFERNPWASTYPEGARIRATLRRTEVPAMWLSGHVHWNTLTTVDGIPHLTLQSLTESFTTGGEPAGAFALLELAHDIRWRVHGRDPFALTLDPAHSLRRWAAPLPPFEQVPEIAARHDRLAAAQTAAE